MAEGGICIIAIRHDPGIDVGVSQLEGEKVPEPKLSVCICPRFLPVSPKPMDSDDAKEVSAKLIEEL
jgi:hypothetical protein